MPEEETAPLLESENQNEVRLDGEQQQKWWNQENYKCLWSCSLQLDDKCGSLLSFAAISFSMITLIFILASSIRLGKFPMIQLKQWNVFPPILWQRINVDLPSKRLSPSFSHCRCPLVGQVGQQWKITWCCTIAMLIWRRNIVV